MPIIDQPPPLIQEPNAFWLGLELTIGFLTVPWIADVIRKFMPRASNKLVTTLAGMPFCAVLILVAFFGSPSLPTIRAKLIGATPFVAVALWVMFATYFWLSVRTRLDGINGLLSGMSDLSGALQKELADTRTALRAEVDRSKVTEDVIAIVVKDARVELKESRDSTGELSARIDNLAKRADGLASSDAVLRAVAGLQGQINQGQKEVAEVITIFRAAIDAMTEPLRRNEESIKALTRESEENFETVKKLWSHHRLTVSKR